MSAPVIVGQRSRGIADQHYFWRIMEVDFPCVNINPKPLHIVRLEPAERVYIWEMAALAKLHSLRRREQCDQLFEVFRSLEHTTRTVFLGHVRQRTPFAFRLRLFLGCLPQRMQFIDKLSFHCYFFNFKPFRAISLTVVFTAFISSSICSNLASCFVFVSMPARCIRISEQFATSNFALSIIE